MSRFRLQLERPTLVKATLLFCYLFLIITSYVVGKVARDALFLEQFKAVKLPYADIAIAVIVGFVVAGYVRLGRNWNLRWLLIASLVSYAASCAGFWYFARFHQFVWLFPLLYVFVGVFGVLATAQVWTLASSVLTTREAKGAFGIIGGGAIAGSIFGGFASATVVRLWGTEGLLLVTAACMVPCIFLVSAIWARRTQSESADGARDPEEFSIIRSMRDVASSPHLRGIAALICLSSFVTTIAGWQFKAIAKQNIATTNALAEFFGTFSSYAGIAALAVQLTLTAPLLRRFGIAPGLMLLPLFMLFGNLGVLALGTLAAVASLRGVDQVFRYSVDKSSVELLYLPVPASIKIQTKSFIDTVVWRFGDGLAGMLVLLFVGTIGLTPTQLSWVSLVLLAAWLGAAWRARRTYVDLLRDGVQSYKLATEESSARYLDRNALNLFTESLRGVKADDILYGLTLLEMEPRPRALPAVRDLLDHPVAEVRRRAISILTTARDGRAQSRIAALMDDPEVLVAVEARLYMVSRGHKVPPAPAMDLPPGVQVGLRRVLQLGRTDDQAQLAEAEQVLDNLLGREDASRRIVRGAIAKVVSVLPNRFDRVLSRLLGDPNPEVVVEAIRSAGRLASRRLLPLVIEKTATLETREEAISAVALYGDRGVGTLRDYLHDRAEAVAIRIGVAQALGRIATRIAARVLEDALIEDREEVRHQVITALTEISARQPGTQFQARAIEAALAAEIADHYFSYTSIETSTPDGAETTKPELQALMQRELERIFRLLSLLYPDYDFLSVHVGVLSESPAVYDNAIEVIENVVSPSIRSLLMPLIDRRVDNSDRAAQSTQLFGAAGRTREKVATAFMQTSNHWLQTSGAYIFASLEEYGWIDDVATEVAASSAWRDSRHAD